MSAPETDQIEMTPERQLALFRQGVQLLGGQRETARRFPCNERTLARVLSGQSALHLGFVSMMARELARQAADTKAVLRAIDLVFMANRTRDQQQEGRDGRRSGIRPPTGYAPRQRDGDESEEDYQMAIEADIAARNAEQGA